MIIRKDVLFMIKRLRLNTNESKQRRVRGRSLTENLKKPYVDWDELVRIQRNGIDAKDAKDFSTTYRLNKDFDLDLKSEVYKWFIQDNLLADLIENEDFWVAEDGHVYIPRGTEFTFYFYPDDDGRHLYIYFLNVSELEAEPAQKWIDRAYNQDDWAYDIINDSTPIDDGEYFAESMNRGKYRKNR